MLNVYFVNAGAWEERDWYELDPPEVVDHWFLVAAHSRNAARYAVAKRCWEAEYIDKMQIIRLAKNVDEPVGVYDYYGNDTHLEDHYWSFLNEDKIKYFRAD